MPHPPELFTYLSPSRFSLQLVTLTLSTEEGATQTTGPLGVLISLCRMDRATDGREGWIKDVSVSSRLGQAPGLQTAGGEADHPLTVLREKGGAGAPPIS